jgi:pimeloyl-[acyl-carrier protein] methyl ester esterase
MRRKQCFVFCHGFGFDSTFWKPLQSFFSGMNTVYLDLGYFAKERNSVAMEDVESTDYIGIGHSLGLTKLLQLNIPFKQLIGLQGFVHFLGFDVQLQRRRRRELMNLTRQFIASPQSALGQFYQRTGVNFYIPETGFLNQSALLNDLHALEHPVKMTPDIPLLVLGSRDDKIVPPELIEDNFAHHAHVTIRLLNQGQHGLGHLEPNEVYQNIMHFPEG